MGEWEETLKLINDKRVSKLIVLDKIDPSIYIFIYISVCGKIYHTLYQYIYCKIKILLYSRNILLINIINI